MGFLDGVINGIKHFKEAAKAGSDFNPLLEEVVKEIESLHEQGKLGDLVYQAEQAYEKEHGAYTAKGAHTDAADSKNDLQALKHFLGTLVSAPDLPGDLKEKVSKLGSMQELMEKALGPLSKILG